MAAPDTSHPVVSYVDNFHLPVIYVAAGCTRAVCTHDDGSVSLLEARVRAGVATLAIVEVWEGLGDDWAITCCRVDPETDCVAVGYTNGFVSFPWLSLDRPHPSDGLSPSSSLFSLHLQTSLPRPHSSSPSTNCSNSYCERHLPSSGRWSVYRRGCSRSVITLALHFHWISRQPMAFNAPAQVT
jgi:hypothetical protein